MRVRYGIRFRSLFEQHHRPASGIDNGPTWQQIIGAKEMASRDAISFRAQAAATTLAILREAIDQRRGTVPVWTLFFLL